jgi:hypothetical protein
LIRHQGMVDRILTYFEGLIAGAHLIPCDLPS